ncbi:MAG: hypothetical protein AAFU03_11740, partial [Bacteroidota bacterium]
VVVPNTVIFSYDLTGTQADSFFLQRSWNPRNRTPLTPSNHYFTETYYYPGFHWAKLIANDSIIRKKRIHIQTDGWLATAKYNRMAPIPTYLNQDTLVQDGQLSISSDNYRASGFDQNRDMVLSYHNVRHFQNISSDHFSFETSIKMDNRRPIVCPFMEIRIIDEEDASWFSIIEKGCEGNLKLKIGGHYVTGRTNDLSGFGASTNEWQLVRLTISQGIAKIYLNEQQILETPVKKARGKVMGLIFTFNGPGTIDFVYMQDLLSGQEYLDTFN